MLRHKRDASTLPCARTLLLPSRFRDNHLRADFVKSLPELGTLQVHVRLPSGLSGFLGERTRHVSFAFLFCEGKPKTSESEERCLEEASLRPVCGHWLQKVRPRTYRTIWLCSRRPLLIGPLLLPHGGPPRARGERPHPSRALTRFAGPDKPILSERL